MDKKTILLIDDDTSLLTTLGDFLRFEGYEMVTAGSGEEGLERLKETVPDLIILDMSMPGMGGMGFLKAISTPEGKPKLPVLVLTARAQMAESLANVDIEGFVAKPCEPNDLLMEVGRILFLRGGTGDAVPAPSRKGRTLVLGEDRKDVRERLLGTLASEGFFVHGVGTGPEVLERTVLERPDAVAVKLTLPGMSGDTVAATLKQMPNVKNIPVVIFDDAGGPAARRRVAAVTGGSCRFVEGTDAAALSEALKESLA